MPVDHILRAWPNLDRHDVPRHLGGKGDHAGSAVGAVFGHEQAAAAGHALEHAEEAATSAHLRVGGHLDRSGHPGELAALAENAFVGFKLHIEHGHGRALNFGLHGEAS